jgi:hypothetical protein
MARPTLTGQTKRMARRQDGKLDSVALIPPVVPPPPQEDQGGPYAVRVSGDVVHGNRVTVNHDGYRKFDQIQGRVVIADRINWTQTSTATPLTFQDQTIVEWTSEYIVIDVDLTAWGEGASALGKRIYVLNSNNGETLFAGISGRKIVAQRTRIGTNPENPELKYLSPRFRNMWAHAPQNGRAFESLSAHPNLNMYRNGYFNAPAGYIGRLRMYGSKNVSGTVVPQGWVGKLAISWTGTAQMAMSRLHSPQPSTYYSSTFAYDLQETDPAGVALYLWTKNATGSTAATFIQNLRIVPILPEHAGETDEDRAIAAIADYDAGFAAKDERLFHPQYLQFYRDANIRSLRFLDWGVANGGFAWEAANMTPYNTGSGAWSLGRSWDVETQESVDPPTGYGGIPYEVCFALAKSIDADAVWLPIPGGVENDWIDRLAEIIQAEYGDQLLAGKKLYVEYGNELWNNGFKHSQVLAQMREYLDRPVQVATATAGSDVLTCEGHGLTDGDTLFFIGGTYIAYNSDISRTRTDDSHWSPKAYAVTENTFKVQRADGTPFIPWTADGYARFMFKTPAIQATLGWERGYAMDGGHLGQIRVLKRLKAQLPANMFANVVKFISGQAAGIESTIRNNGILRWRDGALADLGPLEEISIGPYYYGFMTTPLVYADSLALGRAWVDDQNSYMNYQYSVFRWHGKGSANLARNLEARDGNNLCRYPNGDLWGTRVVVYEWGPHDGNYKDDPTINFTYSAEGTLLQEYAALAEAAAGVTFVNHYGESKDRSYWSVTRSWDIDTPRWEWLRNLGGYIS